MSMSQLGHSEMHISSVGLGTWAIGGDWDFGWGPQDDAHSIAAIRHSIQKGLNWLDTAPIYGCGHAEKIVSQALKEVPSSERPLLFTKCGLTWDAARNVTHLLKADSIRREVEDSLRRLHVDVLDLYQIHWPSYPPGSPDPDLEEAWGTMAELKRQGKIRHMGVSNFDVKQMRRVQAIAPIASLQPPYSMLMRQVEDGTLDYCKENNIGVIVYSPMHNGLLSGRMTRERIASLPASDWRAKYSPAFREPHLTTNLALVDELQNIGRAHGRSAGQVAIAWTLHHPAVTAAIVGARNQGQVDGIAGSLDYRLSDDEYNRIQQQLPESLNMMQAD